MKTFFVLIVIIGALLFLAWRAIPDLLAHALSKKMGVVVRIQDMGITPRSITATEIEVGNPGGSILPKAFSAAHLAIDAPLTQYLKDKITIDEIAMDHIYLGLEFKRAGSSQGNWTQIMQGFENHGNERTQVLIRKLILTNIQVDLVFANGDKAVRHLKPIPKLVFYDVSSATGLPTEEISRIVFQQMLQSVFEQYRLDNMLQDLLQSPQSVPQKVLKSLKGIFGMSDKK